MGGERLSLLFVGQVGILRYCMCLRYANATSLLGLDRERETVTRFFASWLNSVEYLSGCIAISSS